MRSCWRAPRGCALSERPQELPPISSLSYGCNLLIRRGTAKDTTRPRPLMGRLRLGPWRSHRGNDHRRRCDGSRRSPGWQPDRLGRTIGGRRRPTPPTTRTDGWLRRNAYRRQADFRQIQHTLLQTLHPPRARLRPAHRYRLLSRIEPINRVNWRSPPARIAQPTIRTIGTVISIAPVGWVWTIRVQRIAPSASTVDVIRIAVGSLISRTEPRAAPKAHANRQHHDPNPTFPLQSVLPRYRNSPETPILPIRPYGDGS